LKDILHGSRHLPFEPDERALRRFLALILVGIVLGLVAQLAAWSPPVRRIEDRLGDRRIRLWRQLSEADTGGILLVGVDDESLRSLGLHWPLPRAVYARAIDALRRGGASVIGVAVLFEGASPSPVDDVLMQRVLEGDHDVVLASDLDLAASPPLLTLPSFRAVSGFTDVPADADGVVRRFMVTPSGVSPPPNCMALEMLRLFYQDGQFTPRGYAGAPGTTYQIAYAGPPGDTFQTISLKRVLAGGDLTKDVKGRVVLLGSTLETVENTVSTPFHQRMTGVELMANIVHMLQPEPGKEGLDVFEPVTPLESWALVMGLAFLCFQVFVRVPSVLAGVLAAGLVVLYVIGMTHAMLEKHRWLPLVGPLIAIGSACATAVIYRLVERGARLLRQVRNRGK